MIAHGDYQAACRARAKTLLVCTTGAISLSVTSAGYVRDSGSFFDEGFRVGMEIRGSSFIKSANNSPKMITAVTDSLLACPGCVPESTGSRTLSVGLPSTRRYANVEVDTVQGVTYFTEQYIPGPSSAKTLGVGGEIEVTPMYSGAFSVPEGTGEQAARGYIDAFLKLFAPKTAMALPSGDVLRVRSDVGPFPSQLLPGETGFAVQTGTVPLWVRTNNSI